MTTDAHSDVGAAGMSCDSTAPVAAETADATSPRLDAAETADKRMREAGQALYERLEQCYRFEQDDDSLCSFCCGSWYHTQPNGTMECEVGRALVAWEGAMSQAPASPRSTRSDPDAAPDVSAVGAPPSGRIADLCVEWKDALGPVSGERWRLEDHPMSVVIRVAGPCGKAYHDGCVVLSADRHTHGYEQARVDLAAVVWMRNHAEEIIAALEGRLSGEAPAAPDTDGRETTPISAGRAANHPLIRRILLDAWHDLKWYRVNAKEHPRHARKTVEAIEATLHAGDAVLASDSAERGSTREARDPETTREERT